MPSGNHSVELNIPIEMIWEFVSDINKWAPLVPGYVNHQVHNKTQSTWELKGDIGKLQKKVNLHIDITEWEKPSKVTFNIKGIDETFSGNGYFKANELSGKTTKVTGYMNVTAGGMLGPMVNPVLKSIVPRKIADLTNQIAEELTTVEIITK